MLLKYTLVRSKRRTVGLYIRPDGSLQVRAPLRLPEAQIRAWVETKQDWIAKKLSEVQAAQHSIPPARQYLPGEQFAYLGELHPLQVVGRTRPALSLEDGCFCLAKHAQPHAARVFELWYRAQAVRVLAERVAVWQALFTAQGIPPAKKLRISGARTRWGSCSSTGTLSFTWRLVLEPLEIIDYVVVHELAHLRVRNHSKAFWQLVQRFLPDYARRRSWLKQNGGKYAIG